ncbi:unnamed protein product [Heligmosomoides polygyrus]|uniref:Uncharacterized protein n=1 Tax=Heligmosomoides polygyrus TaxID=6339 RepID=A0A183FQ40_HELPZ|nr:unnamed protein product [Heligmosomoides polygyrus]
MCCSLELVEDHCAGSRKVKAPSGERERAENAENSLPTGPGEGSALLSLVVGGNKMWSPRECAHTRTPPSLMRRRRTTARTSTLVGRPDDVTEGQRYAGSSTTARDS